MHARVHSLPDFHHAQVGSLGNLFWGYGGGHMLGGLDVQSQASAGSRSLRDGCSIVADAVHGSLIHEGFSCRSLSSSKLLIRGTGEGGRKRAKHMPITHMPDPPSTGMSAWVRSQSLPVCLTEVEQRWAGNVGQRQI